VRQWFRFLCSSPGRTAVLPTTLGDPRGSLDVRVAAGLGPASSSSTLIGLIVAGPFGAGPGNPGIADHMLERDLQG